MRYGFNLGSDVELKPKPLAPKVVRKNFVKNLYYFHFRHMEQKTSEIQKSDKGKWVSLSHVYSSNITLQSSTFVSASLPPLH